MKKLAFILLLLYSCSQEEYCNLCITSYSINGIEQRRETEQICDIDFRTADDLYQLSSYSDTLPDGSVITLKSWCRYYSAR